MVNDPLAGDVNQKVNDVAKQNEETWGGGEADSKDSGHYNQNHLEDINCFLTMVMRSWLMLDKGLEK